MKFLIAGLGSIGRRHFRNLLALGQRDIVLYRTHQATLPDDELAGFPVETDLITALEKHKPDAVIISNPTALHLSVAIPAAMAGCHLLLEKPISHSMQGVDELQTAIRQTGVKVLVGFQFRFHPTLQKARELITENAIGKILSVRAHWGEFLPNWHPWEDFKQGYAARPDLGGGVVLTLCHPLDYLRMLLGDVHALWAFTSAEHYGLGVEDAAEIGLRYGSGAIGSVHVNYNQRPPVHRMEIVGSAGTLSWDNADGRLRWYQADKDGWQEYHLPTSFERNDLFLAQTRHFLELIAGDVESQCSLEDGIKALQIALAAHESSNTQQVKIIKEK